MGRILQIIYTALFYLAVPFVMLRLLWRARKASAYARRWSERFAYFKAPNWDECIWVHAVSMGEFMAATAMIKALKTHFPELPIVVTTTTPTGSERVQTLLGDSVFHVYVPYDLPTVVKRFLRKTKPVATIVMETELWPNMLSCCYKQSIPVMIANARLSERSTRGYCKVKSLSQRMASFITAVGAQTEKDKTNFIRIGVTPERVNVVGNLKFDQAIPQSAKEIASELKLQWGATRAVWVAASTHEGEEEIVLNAHKALIEDFPQALLVLVPRHPERFTRAFQLAQKAGFSTAKRSLGDVNPCSQVLIVDTMGELMSFYAAADIAFVGGSLVPIGGHNLLEPAALGVPTLTGPHVFNMQDVSVSMVEKGAASWVHDEKDLSQLLVALFQDSARRHHMGEQGERLVSANRGAVNNHLGMIEALLSGCDLHACNDEVFES